MDIKKVEELTTLAEMEVKRLNDKISKLQPDDSDEVAEDDECAELLKLNKKLKYRVNILKCALEETREKYKQLKRTSSIKEQFIGLQVSLNKICYEGLRTAYPNVFEIVSPVQMSNLPKFGDYQFNAAMQVAKILRTKGTKCSPLEVAKNIAANLPENDFIDKIEVVPPGYINMWLKKDVKNYLSLAIDKVQPPPLHEKQRIIVDFSSPNVAKQMHVGHLRSTIIGDSICRLLEFLGHDVVRLNHVGDWGTQFGMLIAHLQEKFPNYINESPPIEDLQTFYKESKVRFDEDAVFKKKAYESVVQLQNFNKDYIKAWQLICDASRKEFQKIYDLLDIKVTERGESFYQQRMESLVKELQERGLLEEDEGRKIMFGTIEGAIPLTIIKSDGGFTYDTSDLAALKQRIEEEKAQRIIYVTDLGQWTHFKIIFNCASKIGIWHPSEVRLDHVGFGVVLGEDKKRFKTRSGETVKLIDLLEEGLKRAEEKLKEKNRDKVLTEEELKAAREAVAFGCIKYADLSKNRTNDYVFSFDKMLEDKGNTAVYMLYALTRIRAISRNANVSYERKSENIPVEHPKEWNLVKTLLRFYDVIIQIVEDLSMHHLCEYLYDIATAFTEFYDSCYCIEKDSSGEIIKINTDRLLLCDVTANVMEKCFDILGLKTVSKM